MEIKSTSSFWADRFFGRNGLKQYDIKNNIDLYKLAAAKRAIGNFVSIVTGKNIPVKFNSNNNSYTDGKTVVIGSNVSTPADFDVAVGLALHEGSHIKLSDFELLQNLSSLISSEIYVQGNKLGISNESVSQTIKDIWNVIEDRRIDNFIYSTSPGYRGYYISMYDKYFNNNIIDDGLKSSEYTDETLGSYMFRIINIHNPNTRLNALKALTKIYRMIGLGTIDRLKSSRESLTVAINVISLILSAIDPESNENKDENGNGDDSIENDSTDNTNSNTNGDNTNSNTNDDNTNDDSDRKSNGDSDIGDIPSELSAPKKKRLEKAIEQQSKFLRDEIKKQSLDTKNINEMKIIEESGVDSTMVGTSVSTQYPSGIKCIIVKKMTKSLMESASFPLASAYGIGGGMIELGRPSEKYVSDGIIMGTRLGKKLQVRAESRNTIFNRQKNGKIDKRMISSLGFGNENVFYYNEIDQYNKANLHISIDASSSMSGSAWNNTMVSVVALCKAIDMIQNLNIQVSIRTTQPGGDLPYIVMAYDSRVDKFSKVRELFPCLSPRGTTPEGLCFEAIEKHFIPSSNSVDSYFVNISDGEPYMYTNNFTYSGKNAFEHTKNQVNNIRAKGIKVLSYFVSGNGTQHNNNFIKMYGKSSRFIDVTDIGQITKTINDLFLQK